MMYDQVANHFAAEIGGRLYDITGDVTGQYNMIPWDKYDDTGQNPPCKNCQGAMRLKTLNNDGTIIYQWREKGKTKQAKWKHGKKIM